MNKRHYRWAFLWLAFCICDFALYVYTPYETRKTVSAFKYLPGGGFYVAYIHYREAK